MARTYVNGKGYRCFSDSGIPVHRWVAEKKVGGKLWKGVKVHHKNRKKLDNRPSNLWVFKNKSEHVKTHWKDGW